jgi:hypothetical protein
MSAFHFDCIWRFPSSGKNANEQSDCGIACEFAMARSPVKRCPLRHRKLSNRQRRASSRAKPLVRCKSGFREESARALAWLQLRAEGSLAKTQEA